jgi:hypothetical protein
MVTRIEMDEKQAELCYRVESILQLGEAWSRDEAAARAKIADEAQQISSFTLDALADAAGTQEARNDIRTFRRRVEEHAVLSRRERDNGHVYYRVLEVTDGAALTEVVRQFVDVVRQRTVRFYPSRSTSPSDREIKTATYASYNQLERTLNGTF